MDGKIIVSQLDIDNLKTIRKNVKKFNKILR